MARQQPNIVRPRSADNPLHLSHEMGLNTGMLSQLLVMSVSILNPEHLILMMAPRFSGPDMQDWLMRISFCSFPRLLLRDAVFGRCV